MSTKITHQTRKCKICWLDIGPPSKSNIESTSIVRTVSVYYVAVRTIVLSRHVSNLSRPFFIHDIIHGLIYVPSTPHCGFLGVSPDGNCAYVH